jgi:hypothetical protein
MTPGKLGGSGLKVPPATGMMVVCLGTMFADR